MKKCINGKYYDLTPEEVERAEMEKREQEEAERHRSPTDIERMEAQILYTALMTDTLIKENENA